MVNLPIGLGKGSGFCIAVHTHGHTSARHAVVAEYIVIKLKNGVPSFYMMSCTV